ncbi:MAG: extracellular solute-binding protein [Brevinematia bacterium]
MSKSRLKIWLISDTVLWKIQTYVVDYFENLISKQSITIEWRFIPWTNIWIELVDAFKSKNPPDIFEVGSTWVATLAELGFLLPLNDFPFRDDFLSEWIYRNSCVKGEKFAVPWYVDLSMLTARKDILDKLKMKSDDLISFEGFINASERIAKSVLNEGTISDILPLGFSFRPEPSLLHNMIPFLWANGWDFPDFSKPPFKIFTDEKAIKTFDFIAKLWKRSLMPKTVAFTNYFIIQDEFFREGRFAFFISHWSPDFIRILGNELDDYKMNYPFTLIQFPAGEGGVFQWGGGSFLCVSAFTREREACYDFLRHFISDNFLKEKIKNEGRFSPYESVFKGTENEILLNVRNLIKKSKSYPVHPLWFSIERFLYQGLSEILWSLADEGEFGEESLNIAKKWDSNLNELFVTKWGVE